MPEARKNPAAFPLHAVGWSLGLFGLLRSPFVEGHFVLPLTRFQQSAAELYAGPPTAPINVTAECSGTDVLALCLAAILAWPVSWRARLAGALGGIALILTLNTVRIGTLGQAAATPAVFEALHLQIWPAILVLLTALYVYLWMRAVSRDASADARGSAARSSFLSLPFRRFVLLAPLFLVAFAFCGPWIARSETLHIAGMWTASEAALLLGSIGVAATAWGNILVTSRGGFMVTPECLATALIPLYVAGIFAARLSWRLRLVALLAMPPLFIALAIARLLLLALPPVLSASPLFLVHGFHQFVLALVLVSIVAIASTRALKQDGRPRDSARRTALGTGVGVLLAIVAGPSLTRFLMTIVEALSSSSAQALAQATGPGDGQGALATLVTFQAGFLLALGVAALSRSRQLARAFAALLPLQVVALVVLGEMMARSGVAPHALFLRALAVALPLALALMFFRPPVTRESSPSLVAAHDSA